MCGTDVHIHKGGFSPKFPLIPGHEAVGKVAAFGKDVTGFSLGDRCVADVSSTCDGCCFFCRRGTSLLCEEFEALGIQKDGGFAEFIIYKYNKVYKIDKISDENATLLESAACAIHGLDRLNPPVGHEALVLGAGPTGLILAQLLKRNGASRVVLAANEGLKMNKAKELNCADEYVELNRKDPSKQWLQLKEKNKYGFDVVVEATGAESVANISIDFVRRGGSLLVYGVYEETALVHWSPSRVFGDEIRIVGSFSQQYCFPRAVAYFENGTINVNGMVTYVFSLQDYGNALDRLGSAAALKVAIKL